jgi:AcrR family transcriptional regulator
MVQATSRKSRLQEAKELMYRTHILDIAEEVFAEHGFEGTQVKVIAGRAKISLSTLYGHFKNKTALYGGVHTRRLDDLMGRLRSGGPTSSDPLAQMLSAMGVYISFYMEHTEYLKMHLREGNAWWEADGLLSPPQREIWRQGLERMAATFQSGMTTGVFVQDDPLLCARTTNAMHQVVLSHWVEAGMKQKPEALLHRLHAQFIRTFCAPEEVVDLLAERDLGAP